MNEELDFSVLDNIDPEVEGHLSPALQRILAALRRLREHLRP